MDVHNHFYPQAYLDALRTGRFRARLESGKGTDPVLHYAGDYNILVPGHRDLGARIRDMEESNMQTHILSLTTPGVHIEERGAAIELARAVNEEFSNIGSSHPERFRAFAALPLQDPDAAAEELRHSVQNLGLVGGTLFTNFSDKTPEDPSLHPVFETATDLGVPLFIHPTTPQNVGPLTDYRLVPLLGFLFDTTTAVSRILFSGVLTRYPQLKLIVSHLGGTLPFVAERLDRGYRVYPEISDLIPEKPSTYLAKLYYDTVAFDVSALRHVRDTVGASQMLLGSDYPHQIGDMDLAIASVNDMDLSEVERDEILGGNAATLFGLQDHGAD
ncbi:MAG: amidohydrolase family protein [Bacillota bacterium]